MPIGSRTKLLHAAVSVSNSSVFWSVGITVGSAAALLARIVQTLKWILLTRPVMFRNSDAVSNALIKRFRNNPSPRNSLPESSQQINRHFHVKIQKTARLRRLVQTRIRKSSNNPNQASKQGSSIINLGGKKNDFFFFWSLVNLVVLIFCFGSFPKN